MLWAKRAINIMMRQFELVERVLAYNPNADEALLNKAYVYAMLKHGMQTRASGDPYFAHPLEVASILTELKLDDATIVVALLHDTIEDTDATRQEIDQMFGSEIGTIVEGLTKIDRLNLVSKEKAQAENLRKLLLAVSKDVRVLLVKLADRLHNMRTIEYVKEEKKQRIAQETMDIYAPLAGRMGMQDMRSELEDISFKILQPQNYAAITNRMAELENSSKKAIEIISKELEQKFTQEGIKAQVSARIKSPWSTFAKIERESISLEMLSDIIGFRVIVENIEDCYSTLGVVHTSWQVVPGRFKDYISVPKHNDYRSIHTTIVGPGRQRVELQIRTCEMHRIAEYGIAAHALYKDNVSENLKRLEQESKAYAWLRSTIDHLTDSNYPEEFLEYTKLELFQDQVFCFTPLGRLIALPRGATPIDFAYAVHSELGDICVGAKINGSLVPLTTKLFSGAEVEIIVDQNHTLPASIEGIAATGKARAAIRKTVRLAEQKRTISLGDQMLLAILHDEGLEFGDDEINKLAQEMEQENRQELAENIGLGVITSEDLAKCAAVFKGVHRVSSKKINLPIARTADGWFALKSSDRFRFRVPRGQGGNEKSQLLDSDTEVKISPEGLVPGDRIVGIMTKEKLITIYPIHSEALVDYHNNDVRWIDVRWDILTVEKRYHKVAISMLAQNKPGMLAKISSLIAQRDANIHNMVLHQASPDFHKLIIELELTNLPQLVDVINSLKADPSISKVNRASIIEARTIKNIDWNMNNPTQQIKKNK